MSCRVCVVGLGYIGLPTAALLANSGYKVLGVDISRDVVDIINKGQIHIVEPGLEEFVKKAVDSGNLHADIEPTYADIFLLAVPTPFKGEHEPDVDYIIAATKSIAHFVQAGNLVILESTSPVGTTELIKKILEESGVHCEEILFAHCPERVLPGNILHEIVENDRVIGGLTQEATEKTAAFYGTFVHGEILKTNARTAEMSKLIENSFRDVNIAFANELSIVCDKLSIDVWDVINLANHHPRVNILKPGVGVGGHCIAVDPWFVVAAGGKDAKLIRTAREVNMYKTEWVIRKIKNISSQFEVSKNRKPTIVCLGLTFKPDIDDLRESPALFIALTLIRSNYNVIAVEPNIKQYNQIKIYNITDALDVGDIFLLLVYHKQFKEIDFSNKILVNFCGN